MKQHIPNSPFKKALVVGGSFSIVLSLVLVGASNPAQADTETTEVAVNLTARSGAPTSGPSANADSASDRNSHDLGTTGATDGIETKVAKPVPSVIPGNGGTGNGDSGVKRPAALPSGGETPAGDSEQAPVEDPYNDSGQLIPPVEATTFTYPEGDMIPPEAVNSDEDAVGGSSGELAKTGADGPVLAGRSGGLLLVAGLLMLVANRRKLRSSR